MTVSLVGYGLGNLGSVSNMLRRIGTEVRVITHAEEVATSDRILLPGVGAFDHGVRRLHETFFFEALREFAQTGKPMLGICLGMQLLADSSEEGEERGLGLIPGRSVKFVSGDGLRVPHMGWNTIEPTRVDDGLLAGLPDESRFYFVHSYHVQPVQPDHALAMTNYGGSFVSIVRDGNVMGAQFHPEKSHDFGKAVLRNFSTL